MSTERIWIVAGRAGMYSDRTEWPVAWYRTKEEAEAHADRLRAEVAAVPLDAWYDERYYDEPAFRARLSDRQCWASDTTYTVYWLGEGPEGGCGA